MKKLFVTTPIYYVNDSPHIGHAYTSIICDAISRFYFLKGYEVNFLTGTDEHGLKVEKAAQKKNIKPQNFVDKISKNFSNLTTLLNLSNNDFIRTTEFRHKKSVEFFWNKLLENGHIYLDKYEGWYSIKDEAFYQEKELIKTENGYETYDGSKVDWIKEESYFFKLSEWEEKLLELYEKNIDFIQPLSRRNEVINFVKGGLKDLSISRTSFKWGIKVPNSKNHIIYVWIDALTNYITSLGYPELNSDSLEYWNNSIHIIGKDILKFHAIYWPALLMSVDLPPPTKIFAHGWWTNEGKKISKSLGNSIDPNTIIDKYGLDQMRYFLLREVTLGQDGDYSEQAFINRINADLANNLGNLIQRTIKLTNKHFNNKFPMKLDDIYDTSEILLEGYKMIDVIEKKMQKFEINKALEVIWNFISTLNQFIDKMQPWNTVKTDKHETAKTLSIIIESIRLIGIILQPFIPDSSNKILDILNIDVKKRTFKFYGKENCMAINTTLNNSEQLFPRNND